MGKTQQDVWNVEEIRQVIRRKTNLSFCYPGLTGRVIDVAETDYGLRIVVATSFGTAYLSASSILNTPPSRLAPGALVSTAYGPGRIRTFRVGHDRLDYVVELVGSQLTSTGASNLGIAYIDADEVSPRGRTLAEFLLDAETCRSRGNAAYAAKNWTVAVMEYADTVAAVREAFRTNAQPPPAEVGKRLLDSAVRASANTAQVYLSMPQPNYELAQKHAEEVCVGITLIGCSAWP
jgi:hypothetical protein